MLKLNWSEPSPPNADVRYHHVTADTPFGRLLVTWKGYKDYPQYEAELPDWGDGIAFLAFGSLEAAQEWCEGELFRRMRLLADPEG